MQDSIHQEPELAQYRAISPWAIATMIAGVASALALVGPLLWWVPLVTIPLAWLAFRQLRAGDPPYVGHTAAVFGMCLAALFAGWAVSQRLSREVQSATVAQRLAEGWLEMLRAGKIPEAHQVQSSAGRRVAPGTDLTSFYEAQAEAGQDLLAFGKLPLVVALSTRPDDVALEYTGDMEHVVDGYGDSFILRYEVTRGTIPGCDGSVWITVRRERDAASGVVSWQVSSSTMTDPTP
jgi:hypothetical protein